MTHFKPNKFGCGLPEVLALLLLSLPITAVIAVAFGNVLPERAPEQVQKLD
jgi:hypothetical protein